MKKRKPYSQRWQDDVQKGFRKKDRDILREHSLISRDRKEAEEKKSKDFWGFSD